MEPSRLSVAVVQSRAANVSLLRLCAGKADRKPGRRVLLPFLEGNLKGSDVSGMPPEVCGVLRDLGAIHRKLNCHQLLILENNLGSWNREDAQELGFEVGRSIGYG